MRNRGTTGLIMFLVGTLGLILGWFCGLYVGINYFPRKLDLVFQKGGTESVASQPARTGTNSRYQRYEIKLKEDNISYDIHVETKPSTNNDRNPPNKGVTNLEPSPGPSD